MVENEVIFKERNETIEAGFVALEKIGAEDNQLDMTVRPITPIHFYCECSDENCLKRVVLTSVEYNKIHTQINHFMIMKGHEVSAIEKVVETHKNYIIVEKFDKNPTSGSGLNHTELDNS